jgi:hypothetical protein
MRIPGLVFGTLVVTVFMGTIGVAAALGAWQTTGGGGEGGGSGGGGGQTTLTGVSAYDIKGRTTLGEVSAAFGVTVEEIVEAFDLPAGTSSSTRINALESDAFSVGALQDWLAWRGTR